MPPLQFQDLACFFTEAQSLERFDIPMGTYNSFFVRVTPYSADYAKEVANAIKAKLARQHLRVLGFAYQDPARHWGRDMMDGFTMVIEMLAVITLAMGGDYPWSKQAGGAIACCTDGLRPVIFKLERLE